jgi:voltage-gated potassium channel
MNLKLRYKTFILVAGLSTVYLLAAAIYSTFEHHGFGDSMWWAFMTFTTVGYGDQFPRTLIGRMAGIGLVASAVFVALPTITAVIATRIIGNEHEFTHDEQEEMKMLLREIAKKHNILETPDRTARQVLLDNRVKRSDRMAS